ncbi:MAG: hypothetical protein ACOVSW_11570 [Candidatus Kapaibacteriota bacterium]
MPHRVAALLLALMANCLSALAQEQPSGALTGNLPQQTQRQVSFDYGGKLMRLTWEFEKQFAILRSYPYLYEAHLFQTSDTAYTLEVAHIVNGKVERELKPLTMQEVLRIRYETSDAFRSFAMWGNEERTAVWEDWALGVGTAAWGLGTGLTVDITNAVTASQGQSIVQQNPIWYIPTLAATGGYLWAVNQPWYNRATATMWGNGLLQGTAHGLALYLLLAPQITSLGDFFLAGTIMGGVEAGAGLALAHLLNFSPAQSQMITAFGGSGLYVGVLAQFATGNNTRSVPGNDAARLVGATTLIGSAVGMWLGNEVAKSLALTGGDAVVLTTPASIVGSAPISILSASPTVTNLQVAAGATIGAIIGGHFVGSALVQNKDFSFLQGRVINLSSIIGGYLGNYIGFPIAAAAIQSGQSSNPQSLLLTSAIASLVGGIVGFTIPYIIYTKDAEEQHQRRLVATGAQANADLPPRIVPSERTWFENLAANTDVQFSPLGMLPALSPTAGFGIMGAGVPIMSIRTILGNPAPKLRLDDEANEVH